MVRLRAVGIAVALFCFIGLIDRGIVNPPDKSSAEFCGWNEKLAAIEGPRIAQGLPSFAITDDQGRVLSGAGQFAELWKFSKMANGGKHIPTWKQESGDCVSMGATNAVSYRQAFQIASDKLPQSLKIPFPPYIYGVSRVLIGKRQLGRQAGSVGAWAADGAKVWGILSSETANSLGYRYSGSLADQWGWDGPPRNATDEGSKFRIKSISPVLSWEDVRDALVHGYPVTVASNVGYKGQFVVRDGKRWGTRSGNWGHQMCFIGAEDRAGRVKGAYCLNSWGPDAHPAPLNDEPPGGFWVLSTDVQAMVSQKDSWAYSNFDGFPGDDTAAWDNFTAKVKADPDASIETKDLIAVTEAPVVKKSLFLEYRQMVHVSLWSIGLLAGLALIAFTFRLPGWLRKTITSAAVIGLLVAGISSPTESEAGRRHQQKFVNCSNGSCSSQQRNFTSAATQPKKYEALVAPPEPDILLAAADPIPEAAWNALESRRQAVNAAVGEAHDEAWNALSTRIATTKSPEVRTYADCYKNEKEFILVVNQRPTIANKLVKDSELPVAYIKTLPSLKPGVYTVYADGKQLKLKPRV